MSQLPIDLFFEGSSASSSSEQLSTLNRISSTNENTSKSEMPVINAIQIPDLGPDSTDSTIQINNFLESRDTSNLVSSSGDNDSSTVVENSDSNSKPKSKIKRKSPRLGLKGNNGSTNSMILESSPVIIEAKGTEEPSDNGPHGIVQRGGEKVFIEPKLAEPHPAYTGLPLESFPNTKIKKESLWSTRGLSRKSNRMNGTNSNNSSGVSRESSAPAQANETENDNESIELDYKTNLQTSIAEEIAVESDIRPPPKRGRPSKKRGRPRADANKNITKTPKQTKVKNSDEALLLRSSKRIKVISPKKTTSTNLAPSSVTDSGMNTYSNDDPTKNNDDFCTNCGGPGVFICCDTCPKSFHFTCCNPPLEECPEDNWHCQECVIKQNPGFKKTYNHIGIFGQLLNQLEGRNPKEFQLPRKIRDNSFIGVTTGENGVYQDATFKPEVSYTKMNEYQIIGFNKNTDLDVDGLYDKNGNPYLCHKCGLSGLKGKTLTHCDYCPLVWHIDCLEDPLCIPKTLGSKWRCPNHFEELLPEGLFSRRKFKDMSVLDISLHNHFLKIASMNNIFIKHNDQQFLKEDIDKSVPLHEYIQYETEDFSRLYINEQKKDESTESSNTNNSDDIHPNFKIPEFFQNYATPIGSTARASKRLNRIMTMTNTDNDGSEARAFIYRVPEKLILLNFISKVSKNEDTNALHHEKVSTDKRTILETIDDYETRGRLEESNQDERDIVDSLIHIKLESNQKKPKTKFSDLVAAALESVQYSKNNEVPTKLNDEEVSDLLDIKRLVELKGKDELLKFLQS